MSVGIPYSREELETSGFRLVLGRSRSSFQSFFQTGEVLQTYYFEAPAKNLFLYRELSMTDPIRDDQSLYFDTSDGLVVLLGCCHSGLMNTLSHILHSCFLQAFLRSITC